jgi:hypothetical protein
MESGPVTKILTSDQMIDVLEELKHPRAAEMQDRATAFARELADLVAEATGLKPDYGQWEGAERGGAAAAFWLQHEGQEVPDIVNFFDPNEPAEIWSPNVPAPDS